MSRKLLVAITAVALSVLAGALPARADRSCSFVCGPDVWCGTRCTYAGQFITCLNYGPCSPSPLAPNEQASGADSAAFLGSLAAEPPAPPALAPLSPLSGAIATAGCGCLTQHTQCCQECAHNNTCTGNASCQSLCSDELQQCQCACQGTC